MATELQDEIFATEGSPFLVLRERDSFLSNKRQNQQNSASELANKSLG